MKVEMTDDFSDRSDHPRKGSHLEVRDIVYSDGEVEYYECAWGDYILEIYPYECRLI
ncbi:hypothetical protein N2618_000632 [Citrobacter freundii]|nr:hypothetical protein [Citrobacter freundii]